MKKRYVLSFLLVICIVCNVFGVGFTRAWFVAGGTVGAGEYDTAKVEYLPTSEPDEAQKSVYGALLDPSTADKPAYLIPGDEIIKPFKNGEADIPGRLSIENFSTVSTNVRAKIECVFLDESGNPVDMPEMTWIKVADNTYEYGVNVDVNGVSVHMGLLQAVFTAATVASTAVPGYTPPTDDATPYSWTYRKGNAPTDADGISFADTWELTLNGGTEIPAASPEQRQLYNVLESVQIVGEHPTYQEEFNAYFSSHYAGRRMVLTISYYAKQLMGMEWTMFTKSVFTANTPVIA